MMHQKYKLYINDTTIYVCQNPAQIVSAEGLENEFLYISYEGAEDIAKLLKIAFNEKNKSDIILYGPKVEKIFNKVIAEFQYIEAAGGIVKNAENKVLLIHRRGFWDLPKGKKDKGETLEQAAIREVQEETGVTNLTIQSKVYLKGYDNLATYHSYIYKGKNAMKVSHWYMMKTTDIGELMPQAEEDIEKAEWVAVEHIPQYFYNMYPSIIDILKSAFDI